MAITPYVFNDLIASNWTITIDGSGTKLKINPCKYQTIPKSRNCNILGCKGMVHASSKSGLCPTHKLHTADIVMIVNKSGSKLKALPSHSEIIDKLMDWAQPRNFKLEPFFERLSFNVLGNIPDSSTLDGMTPLSSAPHVPPMNTLIQTHVINLVDEFFPDNNNASYQVLITKVGKKSLKQVEEIPARILAIIFASLVFCEEANRGDRWFYRTIVKDETKTKFLGGAMPLVYFAARQFRWGVEMKDVIKVLFRG